MKRMLVVELYLPGYVPEAPNSGSLRRWLGLEASLFDVAAMKKLFGQLVQGVCADRVGVLRRRCDDR